MNTISNRTSKDPRLVVRTNDETQQLIARAAELSGRSVTQFLVYAATKEAREVEQQAERIVVNQKTADRMLDLLDNPQSLTPALRKAALNHRNMTHGFKNRRARKTT